MLRVGRRGFLKEDNPGDPRRGKEPFRLLVRDDKGKERVEEADVVLDCTGVYGNPRWLGDGGIPAIGETAARAHIAYGLEEVAGERKTHYADKTTLVIGSGYSAATTVCNLAALAHTQYRWIDLIQISDLTGAYGVSFVVMFVAACLARMLRCVTIGEMRK